MEPKRGALERGLLGNGALSQFQLAIDTQASNPSGKQLASPEANSPRNAGAGANLKSAIVPRGFPIPKFSRVFCLSGF